MEDFEALAIRQVSGKLAILDQRQLPDEETWVEVTDPDHMVELIKTLAVRGAPLIGIAAACAAASFASSGAKPEEVKTALLKLKEARPTAVNLMWAVDRLIGDSANLGVERVVKVATDILKEDQAMCDKMAKAGAALVKDGDGILTHCNTGGLATGGVGTALGVIREAHKQGKNIHVYVDETRPLLQGGRLTTWELKKSGIPFTLLCDNMAATLMRDGKIQRIFVGADRIATNGDFANKIGTYSVAILASHFGIPFHPVAPISTIDFECHSGSQIPIEQRNGAEVRGVAGTFGNVRWAPDQCDTYNPAFDVTPVDLVASLVLDSGVLTQEQLKQGAIKQLKN